MVVTRVARGIVAVPGAVFGTVDAAVRSVRTLWGELETLVGRTGELLDRVDVLLARVEEEADGLQALLRQVQAEVTAVAVVITEARDVITQVSDVATAAGRTRELADVQVQRMRALVDELEVPLLNLVPLVSQAARELQPPHVSGIAALLDQLPGLVDRLEPALTSMVDLAPGMEQVAERMDSVGAVVEGLPGARTLRRRGEAKAEGD